MKKILLAILWLFVFSFTFADIASSTEQPRRKEMIEEELDKPSSIQVVSLPADPMNPNVKRSVTCFTYSGHSSNIIKVVDYGEKGAERLAILPVPKKGNFDCKEKMQPDEFVIQDWSGYFYGMKDGYAFFSADDDSLGGGMPFLVYKAVTHKAVFSDEADNAFKTGIQIQSIEVTDQGIKLRYKRSYMADCSVVTEKDACLAKIVSATGVAVNFAEKCNRSYLETDIARAKNVCEANQIKDTSCFDRELTKIKAQDDASSSYIKYDVEAFVPNDATEFDLKESEGAVMQTQTNSFLQKKSDVTDCVPSL